MRVGLAQTGTGDADELCSFHIVDRRRAAVAHRLAEAADELMEDRGEGPLVGHAALDPLGDEFLDILDVALEIAILREAAPFIFTAIVLLAFITVVPESILWLPRLMGYKG